MAWITGQASVYKETHPNETEEAQPHPHPSRESCAIGGTGVTATTTSFLHYTLFPCWLRVNSSTAGQCLSNYWQLNSVQYNKASLLYTKATGNFEEVVNKVGGLLDHAKFLNHHPIICRMREKKTKEDLRNGAEEDAGVDTCQSH